MKNIVVCETTFKWLRMPLVERLKSEENAKIHFICTPSQEVKYWKGRDKSGVIDSFEVINHFFYEYDNCLLSSEEVYSKARHYEEKYGLLAVDALQTDKHLGRGFFAGGTGHPRSELSDKADYVKSLNLFNMAFRFWEDYLERIEPDLIIGVPSAGIIQKVFAVTARHYSIPVRILVTSRYQNYWSWATDEYHSLPQIKENFGKVDVNAFVSKDELDKLKVQPLSKSFSRFILNHRSLKTLVIRILKQIKSYLSKKLKGIVSGGNYKLSENIKSIWRMHKGVRALESFDVIDTDDLDKMSYMVFVLQQEPEISSGGFSPEFNEQLAAIEMLAKNLPAGIQLLVKEHLVTIGTRPKDFHSTIREIPNAVLISPKLNGLDIARKARCVAVITSSLGMESAMLGIPVIAFGIHNNFNFLSHVHVVESWKALRPLLARLCGEEAQEEVKECRRQDGMRYLAAVKSTSVYLERADDWPLQKGKAKKEELDILYSLLIESLGHK